MDPSIWFLIGLFALFVVVTIGVFETLWRDERRRKKNFHNYWGFWPDKNEGDNIKGIHIAFLKSDILKDEARLAEIVDENAFIGISINEKKISEGSAEAYDTLSSQNWRQQKQKIERKKFLVVHYKYIGKEENPPAQTIPTEAPANNQFNHQPAQT